MNTFLRTACVGTLSSILALVIANSAGAQEQAPVPANTNPTGRMIYPSQGQTTEKQLVDQLECYNWAIQQSGVDPAAAQDQAIQQYEQAQQQAGAAQGGAVGGAARGALAGVAIGAIAGDAGKGAAIGAAAGGMAGGMRSRQQRSQADAQAEQAKQMYAEAMGSWDRAYVACVQGRGYTVN